MKHKVVYIAAGLVAAHLVLKQYRQREPDIHVVEKLPLNFNAVTVPPLGIYITQANAGNLELIKHETVHWRQYQRMGLIGFYAQYLHDWFTHGYDGSPMEMEARQNESTYCQTHYVECVRNGMAKTVQNPNFMMA